MRSCLIGLALLTGLTACNPENGVVDGNVADSDNDTGTGCIVSAEVADGLDNDCDGVVDEETEAYDDDGDSDGFGDEASKLAACAQPSGYVASAGDCYDASAAAYPGGVEDYSDGLDNDCDGYADIYVCTNADTVEDTSNLWIASATVVDTNGDETDPFRSYVYVGDCAGRDEDGDGLGDGRMYDGDVYVLFVGVDLGIAVAFFSDAGIMFSDVTGDFCTMESPPDDGLDAHYWHMSDCDGIPEAEEGDTGDTSSP